MRYILDLDKRLRTHNEDLMKLWKLPVFVDFHGYFTEESSVKFRKDLELAEDTALRNEQTIIPISIDSFGGSVYALLGMIDAIQHCSLPVATIVESKAMSCGAMLFACGAPGHRYIGPQATVMIHTVSSGDFGKVDDLKASTEEANRLNEKLFSMMSKNCGHRDDYFLEQLKDRRMADWYLDANECMKHKLATKIHVPSIKIEIKYDFKFE